MWLLSPLKKALRWWEENITPVIRFTFMMHGCKNEPACSGRVCSTPDLRNVDIPSTTILPWRAVFNYEANSFHFLWNKNDLTLATKQECSWRLRWKKNINKCLKLDALKCFLSSLLIYECSRWGLIRELCCSSSSYNIQLQYFTPRDTENWLKNDGTHNRDPTLIKNMTISEIFKLLLSKPVMETYTFVKL